jgi:hypothetical protein
MKRAGEPNLKIVEIKIHRKTKKEYNYLKYWRIVRYYVKKRYNLSSSELEMMLFFYDEPVFTRKDFLSFCTTMSWNKNRFKEMVDRDIIRLWRDGKHQVSNLYELTFTSKRICTLVYKKLAGEAINDDPDKNKIMRGNSYSDKIYRQMIDKMNKRKPLP